MGVVVRLAALVLVTTGLSVSHAGSAAALDVGCGATVTASVTLERDLIGCPDNGLVVGADNITINLHGHMIDGDALSTQGCPEGVGCDVGVDNSAGHHGVTIKGGAVRDFATGIRIIDAADNALIRLRVSNSEYIGVLLAGSNRARVDRSVIARNGLTTDQAGLVVVGSPLSAITGNIVSGNGDIGLFLQASDGSRITGNKVSDNPEAGLVIDASRTSATRNHLADDGDGIIVLGDANKVSANVVTDATGCVDNGEAGCGYGISLEGGSRNQLSANSVTRARQAGVRVEAFAGTTSDNVVRGNIVRRAGVDGIQVNLEDAGSVDNTLLDHNISLRAGDDGIDVRSASTVLSRNVANNNGALGIRAVDGVSDRGGNRAARNGDSSQCLNVTCAR